MNESYNDKYEFILPELNLNKNLYSEKLGSGSFNSNFKIHNYDTNKFLDIKKMGETNAILGRSKSLTSKKLIYEVEEIYFKNFSDNKMDDNVQSIRATFEIIFLYGTK